MYALPASTPFKAIDWQTDFELGIQDIDLQHRLFLNLINRLILSFELPGKEKQQAALLTELSAYARFHFVSEESIMLLEGYPGYAEHKQAHLQLLDQLSSRINMFHIGDPSQESAHLITFLTSWFFAHTAHLDRQFALFLVKRDTRFRCC